MKAVDRFNTAAVMVGDEERMYELAGDFGRDAAATLSAILKKAGYEWERAYDEYYYKMTKHNREESWMLYSEGIAAEYADGQVRDELELLAIVERWL